MYLHLITNTVNHFTISKEEYYSTFENGCKMSSVTGSCAQSFSMGHVGTSCIFDVWPDICSAASTIFLFILSPSSPQILTSTTHFDYSGCCVLMLPLMLFCHLFMTVNIKYERHKTLPPIWELEMGNAVCKCWCSGLPDPFQLSCNNWLSSSPDDHCLFEVTWHFLWRHPWSKSPTSHIIHKGWRGYSWFSEEPFLNLNVGHQPPDFDLPSPQCAKPSSCRSLFHNCLLAWSPEEEPLLIRFFSANLKSHI